MNRGVDGRVQVTGKSLLADRIPNRRICTLNIPVRDIGKREVIGRNPGRDEL